MNANDRKKIMFSHKSDEWGTPTDVYNRLNAEFNFNLDPCATELNHKCEQYYTIANNGLLADWGGRRVFVNPPYSQIKVWAEKSYKESQKPGTIVVMLVPARTDTCWFHEFVYHKAEIRFIKGRLKFVKDGKQCDNAPFPSMVVIFRGAKC